MANPYVHPNETKHMLNQVGNDGYSFDEPDDEVDKSDTSEKYDKRKETALEAFKMSEWLDKEDAFNLIPSREILDIKEDHQSDKSEIMIIYKYQSEVHPNSDVTYHVAEPDQRYISAYTVTDTEISSRTEDCMFSNNPHTTSAIEEFIDEFYEKYQISEGKSSKDMSGRLHYMNFSNETMAAKGHEDPYSNEVFNAGGKFSSNYNLMVEVHDFAGHPDGDIVHAFALEDKILTYRDKDDKVCTIKIEKDDEMYVDGDRILNKPMTDFSEELSSLKSSNNLVI